MSCHVYFNWSQWFSGTNHRRRGGRCQARARRVSLLRDGGVMEAAAAAGAVAARTMSKTVYGDAAADDAIMDTVLDVAVVSLVGVLYRTKRLKCPL